MENVKSKRLFLDMDGTMYRFHDEILDGDGQVQIDKMYESDFFVNLPTFQNMIDAVRELPEMNDDIEVFVLSSVSDEDIKRQKMEVIRRDFPWIDIHHQLYPSYGENKAEFVRKMTGKAIDVNDTLIDDYNKNLEEWQQQGGNAVKFINNVNHKAKGTFGGDKGNLWEGKSVNYLSEDLEFNIINQIYDDNIVEMDIQPLHCDLACVFFEEREQEAMEMEQKQMIVTGQWLSFITNSDFQGCEITFFDSKKRKMNETIILSSSTNYSEGPYRLTYFDGKMTPGYHEYYKSVDTLAETLSNRSLEDTTVHIKARFAPPTLEQTIWRAVYYARSLAESFYGRDGLDDHNVEINEMLLEALEDYGLQQYHGLMPELKNGYCHIYYNDPEVSDGAWIEHQWVRIPEIDLSIDICRDRFNARVYDESMMYPEIMVQEGEFTDLCVEKENEFSRE